jgi:DNA repair protein RadD
LEINLRDYQQESHDAIINWVRANLAPCLIEAATGAGKSFIIAKVADTLLKLSGKGVLCIAPSAELVEQNREKYLLTGEPASIYSASLGRKDMRHPVVFGTPGTLKKRAHRIGDKFCAVVIDEAHGITPTVKHIIDEMKRVNPQLRVIGLTATPYRLNTGYIYQLDENDKLVAEYEAIDPYFAKLVHKIPAHLLIERGYLTPPVIGDTDSHYDASHLKVNASGKFNAKEVDKAFVGRGRKTSKIVADIVARSRDKQGVMIFAATVQHAQEIMESLPPQISAIVTGGTKKGERKDIIKRFKRKEIKYIVNVSVLTTGFDAPHVDVVALMRATESVGLLQQIIGRGLRLHEDKEYCLILDYAENIERHCPDGDLFNPNIVAYKKGEAVPLVCT